MNNMHEDNQKERDQGAGMGLAVAHGIIKTWAGPSQSDVWVFRRLYDLQQEAAG